MADGLAVYILTLKQMVCLSLGIFSLSFAVCLLLLYVLHDSLFLNLPRTLLYPNITGLSTSFYGKTMLGLTEGLSLIVCTSIFLHLFNNW